MTTPQRVMEINPLTAHPRVEFGNGALLMAESDFVHGVGASVAEVRDLRIGEGAKGRGQIAVQLAGETSAGDIPSTYSIEDAAA
jgi:hypothetical protein